ncbi:lysylphosphatidylglycerol synthase transmembrane domain-containing protein [Pseudofrankia sp. DC12]|uniref:lysylphosphatidylglycerol synthase transmembrane domain-containing protein n=1 Tax=Pseudofrankia sp. DC12 TaxID=683315 RepID=UPI0005F7936D|nr:lysylphosphatidylglycerol synthase transmembrane domain-containing protein [Pseudofrankia sp. DC12]
MEPVEAAQPATALVAAAPSARPFAELTDEPLVEVLLTDLPAEDDAEQSAGSSTRSRRNKRIMAVLSVVTPAIGAIWLGTHRHELVAAFEACKSADGEWLIVAAIAACATYIAAAASMKGAVARNLPFGQLVAVQIAGILPNVLVPAGMGVAALQTRYLLRRGFSMAEAVAATAANATAGALPHAVVLVILLVCGAVPLPRVGIPGQTGYLLAGLGVLVAVAACVPKARRLVRTGARRVVEQRALLAGSGSTSRAALLWGGSIAIPMLHAATLCAIAAALHAPLGAGKIIPVYLVASALSAIIPSPGGFGGLDAALTALLTGAGAPTTTAIAAVLGYRLLTSWLPMAPSAAVCGVLIRTRVL